MTRPVHAPCPAGVSEVVPTVAPASLRAEMTNVLAVGFTSLLASIPQLNAMEGARCGRMKNFTPPVPPHSPTHPLRSREHAVIPGALAHSQTFRDDQRRIKGGRHRARDAAGEGKSVRASFLMGKDVAAAGTRHRYREHFTLRQHPAAAVEAARTEEQHQ